MTDKAPELKPCPHCGDKESQTVSWVDWSYRVVCHPAPSAEYPFDGEANSYLGCGAMGAGFATEKDAIDAWNTRADLAVKVKPLVWKAYSSGCLGAHSILGFYEIDSVGVATMRTPGVLVLQFLCDEGPIETAKAAAQADYERRILSTLEPAPMTPAQAAWQPIATAPRDGSRIVVISVDGNEWFEPDIAWWDDESGRWENGDYYDEWDVTYWSPLPPPRAIAEGES